MVLSGLRDGSGQPPAESELFALVRSGKRRLDDAGLASLSLESRFDLTYNAARALSLAALRYWAYRSESRYVVFQCLPHTLDLPPDQWRARDPAHRKTNLADYEGAADIDEQLVAAMLRVIREVVKRVDALLAP